MSTPKTPATAGATPKHVVIIGGGTAGISVAARLRRAPGAPRVTIIDPRETHDYQPLWTLVGAGVLPREDTRRAMSSVLPKGVQWVRAGAQEIDPAAHVVRTSDGQQLRYDVLVVAAGIQLDWGEVKGLEGNVGRNGICSNYAWETVNSTWDAIRGFTGGDAIFTQPSTPIKCGGAPQKIAYLADEAFRRQGVRDRTRLHFYSGTGGIFAVEKYAAALRKVVERKGILAHFKHDLVEVRADAREAVFRDQATGAEVVQHFDLLHVTPPMSAPDFLKRSPLAAATGWVEVDRHTMRHVRFPEVFALGDCSSLPTSKTGAAIRKQAPAVATNVLDVLAGREPSARYDGYTSCPLVTGYSSLILAEFDYDLKPCETFPFDQSKERWSMYQLKRHVLPALYWNGMLKGRA